MFQSENPGWPGSRCLVHCQCPLWSHRSPMMVNPGLHGSQRGSMCRLHPAFNEVVFVPPKLRVLQLQLDDNLVFGYEVF